MSLEREEGAYLKYSNKWFIERFFKYGSIDAALNERSEYIPLSYMSYYRLLSRAGIIKSPGRQTSLTEALHFFRIKQLEPDMPLGAIYRGLPPSFKTSMNTLHRIYNGLEKGIPGRVATALVLTSKNYPQNVLVGKEVTSNLVYGKNAGEYSIPMTFAHLKDTYEESVLRVLQSEVFLDEAINGKFAKADFVRSLLPDKLEPFLRYRILDVEIRCFALTLPYDINHFTSFKLQNHKFVEANEIVSNSQQYRYGVPDIVSNLLLETSKSPDFEVSSLNLALLSS